MALYLTRSAALERSAAAIRNAPGPAGRFPVPDRYHASRSGAVSLRFLPGSSRSRAGMRFTVRVEADFIPERAGAKTHDL